MNNISTAGHTQGFGLCISCQAEKQQNIALTPQYDQRCDKHKWLDAVAENKKNAEVILTLRAQVSALRDIIRDIVDVHDIKLAKERK